MKTGILALALCAAATSGMAAQVDLTGLSCKRANSFGLQTWEFYEPMAIRYYEGGSVVRFNRVGVGAYEKYDREGEWNSVYLFFDTGTGVHVRLLARPGLITRSENPNAPMETGIFPFNAECVPIWERD
jgi:hypothetical protein